MLHEFLLKNESEILAMTEQKSVDLAGIRTSSDQLKKGLPIFYLQLMDVLLVEQRSHSDSAPNKEGMAKAADKNDEPAMAKASGHPNDAALAETAGLHGKELLRLGYTLSHVVHAYGAMCQSITELASHKNVLITSAEFHDLNRCLDVAIAGAVTEFQSLSTVEDKKREVEHLGALAHELRNALATVNVSLQIIRKGSVGFGGSTGHVLDSGLKRIEALIDRSLTEVRLRVDPSVHNEPSNLLLLVNQIAVTAQVDAENKNQTLNLKIDPSLVVEADQQLLYSAVSNLIQNAIKFTCNGGTIEVRGSLVKDQIVIEVEDECGGLLSDNFSELFKPFKQKNENREGIGLGLTIAQKAIAANDGTIEARNLPGKGCIFKITLPKGRASSSQIV